MSNLKVESRAKAPEPKQAAKMRARRAGRQRESGSTLAKPPLFGLFFPRMDSPVPPRTRRAEARDPATPSQRLRDLASLGCAREVAANPNTPAALLLKLAGRHFEAFAANPVLPLLLLEDPGFCLKIPASTLKRLLRRLDLPPSFLETLARHPRREIRESAQWHVATVAAPEATVDVIAEAFRRMPPQAGKLGTLLAFGLVPALVLEPLAASSNARSRQQVAAYLAVATDPAAIELRKFLVQAGALPAQPGGVVRARSDLSPATLARLARGGTRARWLAARHAATPPEVLQKLAVDPALPVRSATLKNPAVPEAILWASAGAQSVAVRRAVALNSRTPALLLAQLAADRAPEVRQLVARHWATPPETLAALANDPDADVVERVASHRRTPPPALRALAASPHVAVRVRVATHRWLPTDCFEQLVSDPAGGVRGRVARRGDLPNELIARLVADTDTENWVSFDVC